MNFLEAIFSFLFGDGDPNANLEDRRWQAIGAVIRNQGGVAIAEQITPYLDLTKLPRDDEYYMVPVLSHFDGQPEVSPQGDIIYRFPTLQATADAAHTQSVSAYLREYPWPFSKATATQRTWAIGLGIVNLVGALLLGSMLAGGEAAAALGGLVAFVQSIFGVLLTYGIAFLAIPLGRYFWLQGRNRTIEARNDQRRTFAEAVNQNARQLQQKLQYAQQFAGQSVVTEDQLAYTTEQDLLDQEIERFRP